MASQSELVVEQTPLDGVLNIAAPTDFVDFRGSYVELYNRDLFRRSGISVDFVQDDVSASRRGVLRGIHGDRVTWKLVTCVFGSLYLVVVQCDPQSPQYGRWYATTLSDTGARLVLVPPGFGVGHLVLSDVALFYYKQSTYYDRDSQFTYRWDEPRFGIFWPIKEPILSQRDSEAAG